VHAGVAGVEGSAHFGGWWRCCVFKVVVEFRVGMWVSYLNGMQVVMGNEERDVMDVGDVI
jgi:hypothetical protein